ncbi:phage baseplate protein [Castellaniella ginsengisoli]|uniref:Phage baseplate protein n=1 Tax=Castellaniella ginsengisoli TaxID=546114 RepID=A0AB39G2W2_9BURK
MAFLSLLFSLGSPQTMIGSVPLDALLTEDTELTANVTGYAVEDGPPVTDHITQEPERLALSGVVTAAGVLLLGAGGRSKLIQTKEALRQIHRDRLPVTIVTGMDIYADYGMSNAKIGRTNEGEKITITCEFQKIQKVSLRQADIPPAKAQGSAKGKAGQTGAKSGKTSTESAQVEPPSDLASRTGWGK